MDPFQGSAGARVVGPKTEDLPELSGGVSEPAPGGQNESQVEVSVGRIRANPDRLNLFRKPALRAGMTCRNIPRRGPELVAAPDRLSSPGALSKMCRTPGTAATCTLHTTVPRGIQPGRMVDAPLTKRTPTLRIGSESPRSGLE